MEDEELEFPEEYQDEKKYESTDESDSSTIKIRELDVNDLSPKSEDDDGAKYVVIGKPGCFIAGTKVMMSDFTLKNVEQVQIGDQLLGDDYTSRTVKELFRGEDDLYEIVPSDGGQSYTVNAHHILCLCNSQGKLLDIDLQEYLKDFKEKYTDYHGYRHIGSRKLVPFFVQKLHVGNYFGFSLNKNQRFLLNDFTVVHNCGKTTLITSLLYAKKHIIPVAQVISGTEDSNHYYEKFFPPSLIHEKFKIDIVRKLEQRQKIAKEFLPNPWAVQLIDDATDDPKLLKGPEISRLYKNGRHWKMMHILSLQYCMDILPVIRTCIDGTFILKEGSQRNRKILYENYAAAIPSFEMFNQIMDEITGDYTALFINNKVNSTKFEDCVYYYKADPNAIPEGWKFGCNDMWEFHRERYEKKER